jgi:PrcB C-terminal
MNKFLLFLFVTLFISCSNSDDNSETPAVIATEIAQGDLMGNGEEGIEESRLLITNIGDWNALKNNMDSVNNVSEGFTETTIDFENYDVIAIFDGIKGYGGYAIAIDEITENEDNYIVSIVKTSPTGFVPAVMTQPFHIYKIPKTNKPVIFV